MIVVKTIDHELCNACIEGKTHTIRKLIIDGANADYKYNRDPYIGYTPYMFVIEGAYYHFKNELELSDIDLRQSESMVLSVDIKVKFDGFKRWAKEQINNL